MSLLEKHFRKVLDYIAVLVTLEVSILFLCISIVKETEMG